MKRAGDHLRHNVVAYVALFLALCGTSYAAVDLARNSVKSKHIASGAVGASEIRDGSVTSREVKELQLSDFKTGELVASATQEGPRGIPGPAGPPGPPGARGPAGSAAPAGFEELVYLSETFDHEAEALKTFSVFCGNPAQLDLESATGGGLQVSDPFTQFIVDTGPVDSPGDADAIPDDGWRVRAINASLETKQVTVYVTCAPTDSIRAASSQP